MIPQAVLATPVGHDFLALDDVPGMNVAGNIAVVTRNALSVPVVQEVFERLEVPAPPFVVRQCPPPMFAPTQPLHAHQLEAVQWLLREGSGLLADVMGLGKTRVAAVAAETWRRAEGGPFVIIAPRHTYASWAQQLTALGIIARPSELVRVEGTRPSTEALAPGLVWFIHYQIAHAWVGHMRVSSFGTISTAIVDEVHWIRNARARMSNAVLALAGCARHRIGLTGTPLPNRVRDLWTLLSLIAGPGQFGSLFEFRLRYAGAQYDGFGYQDAVPTHVEELHARMASVYLRRTLEDVPELKLPLLTRRALLVEPGDDTRVQQRAWAKLHADGLSARDLLTAFQRGGLSTATLSVLASLRVAAQAVKRPAIVAHVAGLALTGESVVVFTWQRATAQAICDDVARVPGLGADDADRVYVAVHGGVSAADRAADVQAFQARGGVLCATLDSLREGVTLTVAHHVVIADLSWVPSDLLQGEARIARIGQAHPTTSWWALAKGSVDEVIATHLLIKVREQALATHDDVGAVALEGLGLEAALGLTSASGADLAEEFLTRWEVQR